MLPVLQVGPVALPLPGLLLILGLWIGLTLSERYAARQGINPDAVYNLAFTALLAGLAGARLGYAIRFPQPFMENPISLLSPNPGLLDSWSGLLAAGLAALIFGQRKKLLFWHTLDILTPCLATLRVALGLAHLSSGEAFGAPAQLPWSISLWGADRHPSQVYEILAALVILGLIWPRGELRSNSRPGRRFLLFIALSSVAAIFLETFRGDSQLILNGFRQTQVIAWMLLAFALFALSPRSNARQDGPDHY